MDATELRINSYYQMKSLEKKEFEPLVRLCYFYMCKAVNNEMNVKGAPITKQHFVKAGFTIREIGFEHQDIFVVEREGIIVYLQDNIFWHDDITGNSIEIAFVHHLQNLYYNYKRKELVFNEA